MGTKSCAERTGRLNHDVLVGLLSCYSESVAYAAPHHEAHIMMSLEVFQYCEVAAIFLGYTFPFVVPRQFVHIPERPGEESAAPILWRNVLDGAVGKQGTRVVQSYPWNGSHHVFHLPLGMEGHAGSVQSGCGGEAQCGSKCKEAVSGCHG